MRSDRIRLVLLPGMDGTGELFEPLLSHLPATLEPVVVAYPPDEPWPYSRLVEYARGHIPDDQRYVLLGESFSGPIATEIAAAQPANLDAVVFCCSFVKNPQPGLRPFRRLLDFFPIHKTPSMISRFALLGSEWTLERAAAMDAALNKVHARVLQTRAGEVLDVDVTGSFGKIDVPKLYLRATQDRVVPRAASEHMLATRPDISITDIDGPHFLIQARPAEVTDAIVTWLVRS